MRHVLGRRERSGHAHRLGWRLSVGAALALLATMVFPLVAGAAQSSATIRGTLRIVHADRSLHGGRDGVFYLLDTGQRHYDLRFTRAPKLRPNQQIAVTGSLQGATMDVRSATALAGQPRRGEGAAPLVSGNQSTLIMLASWTGADSVTPAQAVNQVGSVDNAWYDENSYSTVSVSATATPWLTVPNPGAGCPLGAILSSAEAAAIANGFTPSAFAHEMVYLPASAGVCPGAAGFGEVGGRNTWILGEMDTRVTVHELGHNLGLWHAHTLRCHDGANEVPFGSSCDPIDEYGDTFDAMGAGFSGQGDFNASQKNILGWLAGRKVSVSSPVAAPSTVTLAPLETPDGIKALSISAPSRTFWVEYRRPIGNDSFMSGFPGATNGVLVHVPEPASGTNGSDLLDMKPNTASDFADAALPVGASYIDPDRTFVLRVQSATASGASVVVSPLPRSWAVVNGAGGLVRGSNVASTTRLGPGRYEVTFNRNVSNCVYTATIGDPGNALVFAPGLVFTAGGHASASGVYVETKNPGGGLADYPFHLFVDCAVKTRAVVAKNGTLVRGAGVTSTVHLGTGRYEVRFNRSVAGCVYTATVGDTASNLVFNPGLVFTAGGHTGPNAVYVETKNLGGGLTDYPFHLSTDCSTAQQWAVVTQTGALARGVNVASVTHLGIGRYEVTFNRDVRGCAYTATIGAPANGLVFNPGMVFTAGGHASANGVYVETKNMGGGLTDFPFHLNVKC